MCSFALSIKFKKQTISSIISLFIFCCPATVRRFVISRRINSINGVIVSWWIPHILKEVFKFIPPFTDRYSYTIIILAVITFATPTHYMPNTPYSTVSHPVSAVGFHDPFFSVATARDGGTIPQVCGKNCGILTAITFTKIDISSIGISMMYLNNLQSAEPLTGKINYFIHERSISLNV